MRKQPPIDHRGERDLAAQGRRGPVKLGRVTESRMMLRSSFRSRDFRRRDSSCRMFFYCVRDGLQVCLFDQLLKFVIVALVGQPQVRGDGGDGPEHARHFSFGQQIDLKVQGRASMRLRFQMVLTDQNETRQKDRLERDQKGEKRERSRSSALRRALDFASKSAIVCTFRTTGDGVGAPRAEIVLPPGLVCDHVDGVCGVVSIVSVPSPSVFCVSEPDLRESGSHTRPMLRWLPSGRGLRTWGRGVAGASCRRPVPPSPRLAASAASRLIRFSAERRQLDPSSPSLRRTSPARDQAAFPTVHRLEPRRSDLPEAAIGYRSAR